MTIQSSNDQKKQQKQLLLIAGALLAIAVAISMVVKTATAPKETVRDPIKNPPAELAGGRDPEGQGASLPAGEGQAGR